VTADSSLRLTFTVLAVAAVAACGGVPLPAGDADGGDAGSLPGDAGADDAGSADAGGNDAGANDAGMTNDGGMVSDAGAPPATPDKSRDILTTALQLDLTSHQATAEISIAGSSISTGASFEVGDLTVASVNGPSGPLNYRISAGWMDVGVPAGSQPATLTVTYSFKDHSNFDGWQSGTGVSFLWPYFCGNLFPCHSDPSDGVKVSMSVTGIPSGDLAVYPMSIAADAPSYMPAVAVGRYTYLQLGTTSAGTEVGVYYLPGKLSAAQTGAAKLDQAFDWYEKTYGPYTFGAKVASVEAPWGPSGYGGMEHHPFWHVGSASLADAVTHYHEAAHGWFGDGVRIACWEDFVLSEGTVSYLAARSLKAIQNVDVWSQYQSDLNAAIAAGDTVALPSTCDKIDILHDPLWSNIPYMKGAFFYRAVEQQVGAAKLDAALAKFYQQHVGKAAHMQDMLDTIQAETGFDPTQLANGWLRSLGHP
jgi:hypothetical protein